MPLDQLDKKLHNKFRLVAAHGRDSANVVQLWPDDRSIFALARPVAVGEAKLTVADPLQLLWELGSLGGDDRLEAAEKLREWLLSRQQTDPRRSFGCHRPRFCGTR